VLYHRTAYQDNGAAARSACAFLLAATTSPAAADQRAHALPLAPAPAPAVGRPWLRPYLLVGREVGCHELCQVLRRPRRHLAGGDRNM
jgi:hypothetical protein